MSNETKETFYQIFPHVNIWEVDQNRLDQWYLDRWDDTADVEYLYYLLYDYIVSQGLAEITE